MKQESPRLTLTQGLVLQDIVGIVLDTVHPHYLHHRIAKAATWRLGIALHEDDHLVGAHQLVQRRLVHRLAGHRIRRKEAAQHARHGGGGTCSGRKATRIAVALTQQTLANSIHLTSVAFLEEVIILKILSNNNTGCSSQVSAEMYR